MKKDNLHTCFRRHRPRGCDYDNYEAPQSQLTGRIVYEDEAVGLRQTGTGQDYNVLELYQPGFEGTAPIPVYVDQDGRFSAMLFDGTYRLVAKNGSGPWVDSGTELNFDVRGNTNIDFPVTPLLCHPRRTVQHGKRQTHRFIPYRPRGFHADQRQTRRVDRKYRALHKQHAFRRRRHLPQEDRCRIAHHRNAEYHSQPRRCRTAKIPCAIRPARRRDTGRYPKIYTPGAERVK